MSEYADLLGHLKRHADFLRARAEEGYLNSSAIEGLMETYIDQPAYPRGWRGILITDALGEDWAEWRRNDYGVGRKKVPG